MSKYMTDTLLEIGYTPADAEALLRYADDNNDHPDWSEDSLEQIKRHFEDLKAEFDEEERAALKQRDWETSYYSQRDYSGSL